MQLRLTPQLRRLLRSLLLEASLGFAARDILPKEADRRWAQDLCDRLLSGQNEFGISQEELATLRHITESTERLMGSDDFGILVGASETELKELRRLLDDNLQIQE